MPALEDSVREYQAMMMPWLVESDEEVGISIAFVLSLAAREEAVIIIWARRYRKHAGTRHSPHR
jgi:hypothetical protein